MWESISMKIWQIKASPLRRLARWIPLPNVERKKGGLGDGAVADAFDYSGRLTRKGIVDRKKMWGRVI